MKLRNRAPAHISTLDCRGKGSNLDDRFNASTYVAGPGGTPNSQVTRHSKAQSFLFHFYWASNEGQRAQDSLTSWKKTH